MPRPTPTPYRREEAPPIVLPGGKNLLIVAVAILGIVAVASFVLPNLQQPAAVSEIGDISASAGNQPQQPVPQASVPPAVTPVPTTEKKKMSFIETLDVPVGKSFNYEGVDFLLEKNKYGVGITHMFANKAQKNLYILVQIRDKNGLVKYVTGSQETDFEAEIMIKIEDGKAPCATFKPLGEPVRQIQGLQEAQFYVYQVNN